MLSFKKTLPFFAIIFGVVLAISTTAFQTATVKDNTDPYWVLKSGKTISTNEADYEMGTDECSKDIHFCGFYAPKDPVLNQPIIPQPSALYNDLNDLISNPNVQYNTSNQVSFRDNE